MENNDQMRDRFNSTWEERLRPPKITENWVYNDEWAKGRTQYITFLIRIKESTIIEQVSRIQENLLQFPCVDPFPSEYLHITVKGTGKFLVGNKKNNDEIQSEELPKLISDAEIVLSSFSPFTVSLSNINCFTEVLCIEVYDEGVIREVNRTLSRVNGINKTKYDYPRFLPHMSISQFKCSEGYDDLIDYLEDARDVELGTTLIDEIELVKALLPKEGRYPRLETLHRFKL
jgi:2'-5' RNA ligase